MRKPNRKFEYELFIRKVLSQSLENKLMFKIQNTWHFQKILVMKYYAELLIFFYRKKYIFVAVLTKFYNHGRNCNKS